jgi:hypothetical protein
MSRILCLSNWLSSHRQGDRHTVVLDWSPPGTVAVPVGIPAGALWSNDMIYDIGPIKLSEADNDNIPVDVWIETTDSSPEYWDDVDEEAKNTKFVLVANNYMPHKARLSGENAYKVHADTRGELVEMIRAHILPRYQAAIDTLTAMCAGTEDYLYYWPHPSKEPPTMNALLKCTPVDQWKYEEWADGVAAAHIGRFGLKSDVPTAKLVSLAYDHALVASAMTSGKLIFAISINVLWFNGTGYHTKLDPFGVPKLTDSLRAELIRAMESKQ